ncbi:hypothetical protein I3842_16G078900 [Carya illinoinensis]|uniref:Uncharacterized protein n=1 Tax=Carya illinoinensis TaxID=32201 RepID=A0A922D947_CARIL|nr:hypothetical protein I3842_16G078900 [Carya illinoinensis]
MIITRRLQEFCHWIYTRWLLLSQIFQPEVPPLPPPPPIAIEAPEVTAAQPVLGLEVGKENMDWAPIIVAFCLSSATGVALSSPQLHPYYNYSPTSHLFSFTISLCFASFFVRHFINSKFLVTARVLYGVGIFFAVTAFFLAITIHFPMCLKLTTWLVYAVSFLVIFVSKFVHN